MLSHVPRKEAEAGPGWNAAPEARVPLGDTVREIHGPERLPDVTRVTRLELKST